MNHTNHSIKILKKKIQLTNDYLNIYELKFLLGNPRIFSCTYEVSDFENLSDEEQQEIIYKKLLEEPSVKNLKPDIKRHGGLMERILVRHDTKQVIEGNSRLAVYRQLYCETKDENWELIPCDMVSKLTEEQQDAYLSQIHIKGKTKWSAYEKANFAYVRHKSKVETSDIADRFGESEREINTRIKVIKMMDKNKDSERSHFSYYNDVLVRNRDISGEIESNSKLRELLLKQIKEHEADDNKVKNTALELRDKLPAIIKKPKVLKKFVDEKINLDTAYQNAKISDVHQRVKQARESLRNIEKKDIKKLDTNERNALKPEIRKLHREVERIDKIVTSIKNQ